MLFRSNAPTYTNGYTVIGYRIETSTSTSVANASWTTLDTTTAVTYNLKTLASSTGYLIRVTPYSGTESVKIFGAASTISLVTLPAAPLGTFAGSAGDGSTYRATVTSSPVPVLNWPMDHIQTAAQPYMMATDATNGFIYTGSRVSNVLMKFKVTGRGMSLVKQVSTPSGYPGGVVLSSDGSRLYASTFNSTGNGLAALFIYRTSDMTLMNTINYGGSLFANGDAILQGLVVGTKLYMAAYSGNKIYVLEIGRAHV